LCDALPAPALPNAADLYLALALKQIGERALVVPHQAGWIKTVEGDYRTIWDEAHENDGPQVELLNELLSEPASA
jgi:hypothetical protein